MLSGESSKSVQLHVKNLCFDVKSGKDKKEILKGIDCNFQSGKIIGLMGPSGSGKTTLINCLSGYMTKNATASLLTINGVDCTFKSLKKISCYVTQDIYLNNLLTLGENMTSAANFKLGTNYTDLAKKHIILDIAARLGLEDQWTTKTGKLSGGERKRLAIAMEIISDPKIIFLDEPTTGLDIFATTKLLNYLKNLANDGKMVICSIHQLSTTHLELLDLVYVMGNGCCAYQGTPQNLVPFLEQQGLPCNLYHNPADYIIEICSGIFGLDKLEILKKAPTNTLQFQEKVLPIAENPSNSNAYLGKRSSWSFGFRTLILREFLKARRNRVILPLRIAASLAVACSIGNLFYNIGNDASKVFFNYNLILCVVANIILSGLFFPIMTVPLEMNIVSRELYNNYYTVGQYYLAITLIEFPISIFCYSVPPLIIYHMSGQPNEGDRIIMYLTVVMLMGFLVHGIGLFFGSCLQLNSAIFFGTMTQIPVLAISGFGLMLSHIPWYASPVSKFLYPRHVVSGIMSAVWGFNRTTLECGFDSQYCLYKDVGKFLKDVGGDDSEYWFNVSVLVTWLVFVKSLTYFAIKHKMSHF